MREPSPDVMPIGQFARRTGLSIGALRHYAELGLLTPARVDPTSGYRYYGANQVERARLVAALRDLDVPLARMHELLDASPAEQREQLRAHHAAVEGEIWRLQRRAHRLRHIIDHQEDIMPSRPEIALDPDDERRLAGQLFNHVWTLLERSDRTRAEDDEMLHAAHASRHHWGQVGLPVHWARGEWQCSRVYAVLGRSEPALHHARRTLELAEVHDLGPFDVGCGHEALARAHLVAGDAEASAKHAAEARIAAEKITDDEDRDILLGDLTS